MICYFLYMIDITILYLFTYNGLIIPKPKYLDYRDGFTYRVYIYQSPNGLSIPCYINRNIEMNA